ncbi:50S ribosomal protein L23 [Candidatus Woesearchaeota archaeon]|nr:50S ribosomal protein L23 [Candidatus Woesearchaeota archaeon]
MKAYTVIKNPLATEKAVKIMETENKLVFIVEPKATKREIKEAIEEVFKVKVKKVSTLRTLKGKKKAYATLEKSTPAVDVATQLGLM